MIDDPAEGWNLLLSEVSNREARIDFGVSGENVRAILEVLATLARSKDSGIGPIRTDDIVGVFSHECGFAPTDEALIVLQRLPGLGRDSGSPDDSRAFVDIEFADACRAGDLVRFCLNPYDQEVVERLSSTRHVIGPVGIAVSAVQLADSSFNQGLLTAAMKAVNRLTTGSVGATSADLAHLCWRMELEVSEPIQVAKVLVDRLELTPGRKSASNVTFADCFFNSVEITPDVSADCCPEFQTCLIQELEGRISLQDLPAGRFPDTIVESFVASSGTTNATLSLQIPIGARVLITILKKLFVRSLGGRKENALYRGLDATHQAKVDDVLSLLAGHGIVTRSDRAGDPIWIPVRRYRSRVLGLIAAPSTSSDPVLDAARKL